MLDPTAQQASARELRSTPESNPVHSFVARLYNQARPAQRDVMTCQTVPSIPRISVGDSRLNGELARRRTVHSADGVAPGTCILSRSPCCAWCAGVGGLMGDLDVPAGRARGVNRHRALCDGRVLPLHRVARCRFLTHGSGGVQCLPGSMCGAVAYR